jgi:F420-non-reducing hydrogenase small subunit
MSDAKPKVAFYWCSSCGGCEESIVDLAEDILKVVAAVDIVFWPVALDFKKKDVEAMPDKSIAVSFINGAIRMSEQEEMAQLLRRKSQIVVAMAPAPISAGSPGWPTSGTNRPSSARSITRRPRRTIPAASNPSSAFRSTEMI